MFETHVQSVLQIATKYQLLSLVSHCEDYLSSKLSVVNVLDSLCLADKFGALRLKEK